LGKGEFGTVYLAQEIPKDLELESGGDEMT